MIKTPSDRFRLWLAMLNEQRKPLATRAAADPHERQIDLPRGRRFHQALRLFDFDPMPLCISLCTTRASGIELSTPNDPVLRLGRYWLNGFRQYVVTHSCEPRNLH